MSLDNPTLIPVPFHGDTITCIETPKGVFVPVTPICDRLGLSKQGQFQRLNRDPGLWGVCVIHTPSAGGTQEMNCIPVNRVAFFLATIDTKRVKPEIAPTLERYQREAADVLDRHFRQRAARSETRIADLERMLWHGRQHLLMANPKWDRAYKLMEMGQSDYVIAQRCGWSMDRWREEQAMMRSCGAVPKWREEMATLEEQLAGLKRRMEVKVQLVAEQAELPLEG